MWVVARGGREEQKSRGREEAAVQCKKQHGRKRGSYGTEREREGRGGSQQYSSPSALFSHYCLFSLKFLSLLVKMPTRFSVSVLLNQ